MSAIESLKDFMKAEGITQTVLAEILKVPPSRISEWCNFKRNCTAVVILDLWIEVEAKSFAKKIAFRLPVHNQAIQSLNVPHYRYVEMFVGAGIWGIVKLFYFKNQFLNSEIRWK